MAFKKLTAGLMASSLILGLAPMAAAEITSATPFETAVKMNKLGIVQGVGNLPTGEVDFNLGGNLTRAELVTTIVRSFGAEQAAKLAAGAPSFADVKASDWFSGYVAVAKNLAEQAGTTIGRDANTFDPNASVSKAEALVFVMKYLGVKVESTGANWYEAWIAKAIELGMVSEEDAAVALANPGTAATRGEAFVILDFGYSAKVLEGGASLYTAYVDSVKPTVEASAPETTGETKVTVSGKVSDNKAVAAVFVNGNAVEVTDGNFSAEVELKVGENSIEVSATDISGNTAAKTLKVTRANAEAASIEAADVEVAAGGEATVSAKLLDANGAAISDAEFTGTSELGTFEGGKFTAGTKAGEGTLILKSGEIVKEVKVKVVAGELAGVKADKESAAVGAKVTLTAVDQYGNAISGATFAQDSADAFLSGNGFVATKAGSYKVTATVGGKSVEYTVAVYSTTVAKYAVKPSVTSLVANNASTFTVEITAQDANGNAVLSSGTTDALTFDSTTIANFEVKAADGSWGPLSTTALVGGKKTLTLRSISTTGGVVASIKLNKTSDSAIKGSADVELVDQVASSIAIVATDTPYIQNNLASDDPSAPAANNGTVEVKVLDQDGKLMKSGAYAVKVEVSGAGAKLVDSTADANPADSKTLYFFGGSANPKTYVRSTYLQSGDITVTASATGLTSGTAKFIAASAFAASKLQVSADVTSAVANLKEAVTFGIRSTDANGVPNSKGGTYNITAAFDVKDAEMADVSVSVNGGAYTSLATLASKKVTIDIGSGVAELKVKTNKKVGDIKVTFSDPAGGSAALASDSKTVTFKADAATQVGMLRTANVQVPVGTPEAELSAQLYDAAGNVVKEAGRVIEFSTTNTGAKLNGAASPVKVTTDADGKATVKVTLPAYVSEVTTIDVVGASGESLAAKTGAASTSLTVVNQTASTMTYVLTKSSLPVSLAQVGDTLHLAVTVKDAGGRTVTGQALTVEVKEGDTLTAVVLNETGTTGVYEGDFVPTTAGRVTLEVKNSSAASAITMPVAVNVRAGAFAAAKIEREDYTDDELATTKNVAKMFRVVPLDSQDNLSPKATAGDVTVTWAVDPASLGSGEYFEIRSSETGASVSNSTGFKMGPGVTGQAFFVLTNAANAKVTFTFTHSGGTNTDVVYFQAN